MSCCAGAERIERPGKAHLVLITDLYEGGNAEETLARLGRQAQE